MPVKKKKTVQRKKNNVAKVKCCSIMRLTVRFVARNLRFSNPSWHTFSYFSVNGNLDFNLQFTAARAHNKGAVLKRKFLFFVPGPVKTKNFHGRWIHDWDQNCMFYFGQTKISLFLPSFSSRKKNFSGYCNNILRLQPKTLCRKLTIFTWKNFFHKLQNLGKKSSCTFFKIQKSQKEHIRNILK